MFERMMMFGMEGEGGFEPADQRRSYISLLFFSSHSWHFLTVPPYSQYYLVIVRYWGSGRGSKDPIGFGVKEGSNLWG
jgi:hypothetical protein